MKYFERIFNVAVQGIVAIVQFDPVQGIVVKCRCVLYPPPRIDRAGGSGMLLIPVIIENQLVDRCFCFGTG